MPSFLTDNRLRIILGIGCLLLGSVNAIFYYRDIAVAAKSQAEVPNIPRKTISHTIPSPTSSESMPTSTPIVSPAPSPTSTPKSTATPRSTTTPQVQAVTSGVSGKVKISTASEAEFDTLPGIGPSKAKAIVEYRASKPFTKLEDLKEVTGIGDKTYESLLPYIEL